MLRRLNLLPLLLLLSLAAGCQQPIGKQLYAERQIFNAQLDAMHVGFTVGVIGKADVAKALPYERATSGALDAGDAAYLAGDTSTARIYLRAAAAGVAKLPTTRPIGK